VSNAHNRDHSIGLGFRVPLVVASPWSRGGCVNSEVFDHTSVIQLVETWLAGKGKPVKETNISDWRRTVCGDLTSVFRPYRGEAYELPKPLDRDQTIIGIHKARFMSPMKGAKPLAPEEIDSVHVGIAQEPGTRPSCPLPYELEANAKFVGGKLEITMEAGNKRFGKKAVGCPFNVYSYGQEMKARAYAVKAGDKLSDALDLEPGAYHVRIDGPNGFLRQFNGPSGDPQAEILVSTKGDQVEVVVKNAQGGKRDVEIQDVSYGAAAQKKSAGANGTVKLTVDTKKNHGWYNFTVNVGDLSYRYAGRIETGQWSITDPAMS